jgi:hypothetical protein
MISPTTTVLMIVTALLGVGSPLAAMAQVPEENIDLSEVIGISSDVVDRVLDDVDAQITEIGGPDVGPCDLINLNPLIGTTNIECDIFD